MCDRKQQYVLEVAPGKFAARKLVLRMTEDLYSADKFWSLDETIGYAREYNFPNAKIRVLRTQYSLHDEFTLQQAKDKYDEVMDIFKA